MKKQLLNLAKIIIPLGFGIFLIWYFAQSLDEEGKREILRSFQNANYGWILFSLVFAVLSHISRAYRWKYTLRPLGYEPKFWNSFFAVMIAYLVNLAVPRLGEFSRCGVMSKYEKIPFEKLLGTVIAERVADFIILIVMTVAVALIQLEVLGGLIEEIFTAIESKFSLTVVLALIGVLAIGAISLFYLFFSKSIKNPLILKVREFVAGIFQGVAAILKMKDKWAFIGHTIFIWVMYVFMFYLCFFSLPETNDVPFGGVLTAFVMGGFTVVLTNGGIGAYPLAIVQVLSLYGISEGVAGAFGWIVWSAQTILLLVFGAISFALMPLYNKMLAKNAVEQA